MWRVKLRVCVHIYTQRKKIRKHPYKEREQKSIEQEKCLLQFLKRKNQSPGIKFITEEKKCFQSFIIVSNRLESFIIGYID